MGKETDEIIKKLNEITDVKKRLDYLEELLKKSKDTRLEQEILNLIELVKKSGSKKIVLDKEKSKVEKTEEKENSEKKKTAQQPLEELVFRRTESFDSTPAQSREEDYKTAPSATQQRVAILPGQNLIEGDETYKTIDVYKKDTEKKDYLPKFEDSTYKTQSTSESSLASEISAQTENFSVSALGKKGASPQLEQFFGEHLEKDTEEYKRKEIFTKSITSQEEEREAYKKKLRTQFV